MYILLHSKDLEPGLYGFQVIHQVGASRNSRYGKPEIIECHSARSAMSYANGLINGYLTDREYVHIPIMKTPTFEAQLKAELES